MAQILTKSILDSIANVLYTGATVAFYSITPTSGETLITTLTNGFAFARERRAGQRGDSSGVKLWIAGDASITRSQIKIGGVVVITANGVTTKYKIFDLQQQQQLGAGFILRLEPLQGAAG